MEQAMYELTYRTDPIALFLEGLYHYYPLVRSAGSEVSQGMNRLYQIQSAGIPGNISHIINAQIAQTEKQFVEDTERFYNKDIPGIDLLQQADYASYAVNCNLASWIILLGEWIKMGCNIERFKIKPKGFPEIKYWTSLFGGMIEYTSYSPGDVVCDKMKKFVYTLKRVYTNPNIQGIGRNKSAFNPIQTADILVALDNLYSSMNTQMQYLNRFSGKVYKPEPMPYGAILHFVHDLPFFTTSFSKNKDTLLKMFNILYQLCRMLFGYVGGIHSKGLLCLNQEDEYTRISDTMVAAIPAPNPNSIHYFREEQTGPLISQHALFYVDRVCAAYKGYYKSV